MTARLLLILALLGIPGSILGAQEREPLRFEIAPGTGAAMVEIGNLFSDAPLVEAVLSGLPLRIRIRIQLWKDGFFDNQEGQYDWWAIVLFDPLTRRFGLQSSEKPGGSEEVNTLEEAQAALETILDVPIRPTRPGRYYYMATVEMETLSLSDLEELQRWLQGELGPVVAGERDIEGALAKGFRRILVRMLGLPAKRQVFQSPTFRVESADGGGKPEVSWDADTGIMPSAPIGGR